MIWEHWLLNPYNTDKFYPIIYAKENLSVINGGSVKTDGLGMSQQTNFIEATDDGATNGVIKNATSIQPFQTSWEKDNSYMQTAFRTAEGGTNYYNLLIPQGSSTIYWLASRCIYTISIGCNFEIRNINDGGVVCRNMYFSGMGFDSSCALFPIVSLSSSLISKDSSNNFTVNI